MAVDVLFLRGRDGVGVGGGGGQEVRGVVGEFTRVWIYDSALLFVQVG